MNIYKQKDGRKFIVYKGEDNKYHSKAYARYLLGKKSNRTGNFLIECHQIRGKSQ